jgi:hypothetical protein
VFNVLDPVRIIDTALRVDYTRSLLKNGTFVFDRSNGGEIEKT